MSKLNIESPTQLWSLLKNKQEVFDINLNLRKFILVTERYIRGCKCGNDNQELMEKSYNFISTNIEVYDILLKELNLDEITFNKI
jgi:hypothetical protein